MLADIIAWLISEPLQLVIFALNMCLLCSPGFLFWVLLYPSWLNSTELLKTEMINSASCLIPLLPARVIHSFYISNINLPFERMTVLSFLWFLSNRQKSLPSYLGQLQPLQHLRFICSLVTELICLFFIHLFRVLTIQQLRRSAFLSGAVVPLIHLWPNIHSSHPRPSLVCAFISRLQCNSLPLALHVSILSSAQGLLWCVRIRRRWEDLLPWRRSDAHKALRQASYQTRHMADWSHKPTQAEIGDT